MVKRFSIHSIQNENPNGSLVEYSDYQKLEVKHRETANQINQLQATNARLAEALKEAYLEELRDCYGRMWFDPKRENQWSHSFMSDGEWLAHECGLNPKDGWYPMEGMHELMEKAAQRKLDELLTTVQENN